MDIFENAKYFLEENDYNLININHSIRERGNYCFSPQILTFLGLFYKTESF